MTLVKFNNEKNGVKNYSPFNDLFDSFFRDSYYNDSTLNKVPAVNIYEAEEAYTIEVAAPGLKKENFKLQLEKNILKISAEKASETENNHRKVTRKEFSYHAFARSFTLPETVDFAKIYAKYEDGVLYVTVGKKEEAKIQSREIAIS
jgi:HSP20 family protein